MGVVDAGTVAPSAELGVVAEGDGAVCANPYAAHPAHTIATSHKQGFICVYSSRANPMSLAPDLQSAESIIRGQSNNTGITIDSTKEPIPTDAERTVTRRRRGNV